MKKKIPYIILIVLLLLVFFLAGIQYGQTIRTTNDFIDYVQENYPTPTQSEQQFDSLVETDFNSYINTSCDAEFLYPAVFEVKQTTKEATFTYNDQTYISVSCTRLEDTTNNSIEQNQNATIGALLTDDNIIYSSSAAIMDSENKTIQTYQTQDGKNLEIISINNLFKLIESTIEF